MDSQLKPTKVADYIQDINSVLLQPLDSPNTNFIIEAAPFRIKSYINEELTMTLNENDTLYFEKSTGKNAD